MNIEIIKMHRKTIALKLLDSQHAELRVPFSISQKKIDQFLLSKQKWLSKNSEKLKNREMFANEIDLEKYIYLDGKPFMPVSDISFGFDEMPQEKKHKLIKKTYLSYFNRLIEMAELLSQKTGLKYKSLKPTTSVRIWGSYNTKGVMKLNWKLLILPLNLAEYVVVHELCHSKYMNHQPKFWKEVEIYCPDFKNRKKQLDSYGFLLKTDI